MKFEKMNALAHLVSATVNRTTIGLALLASVPGISTLAHAQDECAQAVPLTVGTAVTFTFTSTFPTASASVPVDTQCADGTLLWTETTPDLWYSFVAPSNGLLTLDTCEADPFNSADTSLVLYTGDCGSLVQVACNGDFFGFNPAGTCSHTTARINSYLVIEGTTYWVRVASIDGSLGTILPGHITATMSKVGGWGQTASGQISAPSALGLPSKISAGTQHALGLSGGVVFAWGNNGSGRATVPAGLGTVIDISAGGSHSLALRSGGTVAGWGLDTSLRATGGSTVTNAVAIAAGGSHSLAALATGTVFGWGVNTNGQITIPAGLTGVVKVTAGVSHSVALRSNGAVTAWGLNTGGQATVPGGLVASKIASSASSGHTLALRENGTIIGWGLNTSGQTNIPAGLTGMIDVAAGAAHSIALFADGTVATWGSNNSGELTVPSNLGPSNIVAAGAGYSLTVFNEDALDLCPNDPNKLRPGQCGCGVADTDTDSDGTLDCNDGCPTVAGLLAPRTFFADVDLDTFGNAASTTAFCSLTAPEGFAANSTDCDDASLLYADADNDTYGAGAPTACGVALNTDCNDSDAAINPAATEICEAANVDENCNNLADNADSGAADAGRSDFYADSDSDSYTVAAATRFCDIAAGYLVLVSASIDCNDSVAAINPSATEICDAANADENCNNLADNADIGATDASKSDFFADSDADTYTVAAATRYCDIVTGYLAAVSASIDCNDSNAAINPGATEICDALDTDENCNGFADNADNGAAIASKSAFFADADADTYTVADPSLFCDIPATGYIFVKSVLVDCNDTNNTAYPGAVENCANDGVDNNCNGEALADDEAADSISYCADIDSDGFGAGPIVKCCTTLVGHVTDGTDCNDADATVYPGAVENCANVTVDNNCNGSSAESEAIDLVTFYADTDADGSGDSAVTALACSAPSGYTVVAGDGCPSDANKITPGICGCGTTDADGDNDGLVYCFDNCPSVANADQANCDSDTLGNACDLDDDNDGAFDINDAFACNAAKSNLDSTFTTAQISAFLTTASAATVDATSMSIEQLGAIADGASSIAVNGISGTFTVNSALTSAQISAILGKVQPIGGVGGAIVTVDATNMTDAQLGVVAASIASVTTVENVSITASLNANAIAALVSKTPAGEAAVNATGMSAQQLMASISGSTTVTITGTVSITSALTAAQIAEITGSIAPGTTVNVDTLGMSAAQQAALLNATAIIVDSDAAVSNGGTFTVYIDLASMPVRAVGIQARVMFDPAILQFVPPVPDPETGVYSGVGGLDFPMEIFLAARANSVDFSTGVDFVFGPGQGILGGNVAQLTFRAIAPVCAANNLVWLASSGFNTCISSEAPANGAAVAIPYSTVNLANISALNLVDFAGVPVSDPSSAADAGTLLGAAFTQPTVTASNNCGSLAVTTTISYPADSGIANGSIWPSHFPIGVSTVTWSAVDARGVTSSVSRTYTVLNYQLATIDVDLVGGVNANLSYTLPIRVRLSTGLVLTTNVAFTGNGGAATDIQIPVRSDYSCISVKDATHTVSAAQTLQVTGAKYTTSVPFGLVAGDSNDDNLVDILDFGHFVSDRGAGKTAQSRSNFDRNLFVNNGDFGFISINFLRTGDLCGGGYTGNAPIERVSVKDLRRAGLGHMAAADINNDGWVDASDMALAMQGIYRRDVPTTLNAADEVQTTRW